MIIIIAARTLLILRSVGERDITTITFAFILTLIDVVGNNILDHDVELAYIHGLGS